MYSNYNLDSPPVSERRRLPAGPSKDRRYIGCDGEVVGSFLRVSYEKESIFAIECYRELSLL